MNSSDFRVISKLLALGLMLAVIKIIYLFFDPYNIFDFIVFFAGGFLIGGRVPSNRRYLGLLLALPAFALCLLFVKTNGYSSIMNGVGTSYAISLVVIPLATSFGLFVNAKRALRTGSGKK